MRGGYGGSYRGYDDGGADPLASAIQNALSMGLAVNRERRARKVEDEERAGRAADRAEDNRRQQQAVDEQGRRDRAMEERLRRQEEREQGQKLADAGVVFANIPGQGVQRFKVPTKAEREATLEDTIKSGLAGKHALETAAARGLTLPANATGAQAIEAIRVADQQEAARLKADAEKTKATTDIETHRQNRLFDAAHPLKDPNALPMKRVPASVGAAYINNTLQMSKLDDAIAQIEKNPKALGLKAYIPNNILNRMSGDAYSGGVDTRAGVADVGSLIIHDRSGAAVTVSEAPRLKPFIPAATDDAKTALAKLRRLREFAQQESDAMGELYGEDQGYTPLPGRGKPVAVTAPRTRPRTGDVIR